MRIIPMGDRALLVEFGSKVDEPTHHRVQAAFRLLASPPLPGVTELVPAFTTLTLFYDVLALASRGEPGPTAIDEFIRLVRSRLQRLPAAAQAAPGRLLEVPVCYGGAFGPDLEEVAVHTGLAPGEVARRHSSAVYVVYMIGFSPGFPYLGGLPDSLVVPRRATARTSVPAGSVGIANRQSCIYPMATPGGWSLIGRTGVELFRPDADPPSLLHAGDRVKFRPVTPDEFGERKAAWV